MTRASKGTIHTHVLADGTRAFHLRFRAAAERHRVVLHELAACECGCGGGWTERSARTELGNLLARVRAGVWRAPTPQAPRSTAEAEPARVPTFHEYASYWLQAKIDGAIGDTGGIAQNTISDYRTRLSVHLLPFFARYRLDEIDGALCLDFKAYKLAQARELRDALDAGADIRDRQGRRARPLSLASVRRQLDLLRSILDEAIEDTHITVNPARSRRMKLRVPKPRRTFLEMDELATLLESAAAQDRPLRAVPDGDELSPTTKLVAHLLAQGKRPHQIARRLDLARSTVSWHLRRLGASPGRGYQGRRVICELLGRSGIRASELCDLKIDQLRIHDPAGAHFDIPDAKTDTGIREVQMTPDLAEAVIDHLDRLQRAGLPHAPTDYLVPSTTGTRLTRQRVARIVREAATEATRRHESRGLPPLPHITPHSLRRTYISIALIANNFDVKWVMSQVGHADSKMTMDVYAQVEQRADRRHGENFDRLLAGVAVEPDTLEQHTAPGLPTLHSPPAAISAGR